MRGAARNSASVLFDVPSDFLNSLVNGKLKDECAYLETTIEVAIETISKQGAGAATGKILEGYGVSTLISAYKQLCD